MKKKKRRFESKTTKQLRIKRENYLVKKYRTSEIKFQK